MLQIYRSLLADLAKQMGIEIPMELDDQAISFDVDGKQIVTIGIDTEHRLLVLQCDVLEYPVREGEERKFLLANVATAFRDGIQAALHPTKNCLVLFRINHLDGLTVECVMSDLERLLQAADRWCLNDGDNSGFASVESAFFTGRV